MYITFIYVYTVSARILGNADNHEWIKTHIAPKETRLVLFVFIFLHFSQCVSNWTWLHINFFQIKAFTKHWKEKHSKTGFHLPCDCSLTVVNLNWSSVIESFEKILQLSNITKRSNKDKKYQQNNQSTLHWQMNCSSPNQTNLVTLCYQLFQRSYSEHFAS